ncbi:MAG TPA: S41 family peptidase [Terriglobales bacterium]|nr:S41 family peptidase [Terriglobales bacterium]
MSASSRRSLFLVLLVLLACGSLGALLGQRLGASGDAQVRGDLQQFSTVYALVEENYADPVDPDKAIYNGAIPGMLRVLDPHSDFFDPKAFSALNEEQHGKYYGVGMTVGPRDSHIIVIAPFVGTPAYRAGIRPGDVIVAVDGVSTDGMGVQEVSDRLRGDKGTTVHITIARDGVDHPLEFTVVRGEIPRNSVDVKFLLRPGIGYIHVSTFNNLNTAGEVAAALQEFGELKGLVLDLRGNPGGIVNEAVGVADQFLQKGQVVVTQRGRSSPEVVLRARHGASGKDYPIVVLVNRGTASAAEIFAGAIQDHDRGLIAGETTFGKGLVQSVYPLSDNAGLALTTARYYTPSGRLIQRNYNGVPTYDYYLNLGDHASTANREVRLTDSGRTVYGGGGITPDVSLPQPKPDHLQQTLLQHYAFFNFAKSYLANRHVTRSFAVDENVLNDFRHFLQEQKIPYTEADLLQNLDWVKTNIKSDLFVSEFGQQVGLQVQAENDPEIQKAADLLPKAKELADNARRTVAQRQGREDSQ